MKYNTLINILDNFNDDVAYMSKFINPKKVINIAQERDNYQDVLTDMCRFLTKKLEDTHIVEVSYNSPFELQEILEQYANEHTLINISSGNNLSSAIAYEAMLKYKCSMVYMDVSEEKVYRINAKGIKTLDCDHVRFGVKDYIAITGGKIVTDDTVDYMTDDYYNMLFIILDHYDLWITTKDYIRNHTLSQTDVSIDIASSDYNTPIKKLFRKFMTIDCVKEIREEADRLILIFKNDDIRKYILSGIWLEHFTYNMVKEHRKVTDVKTGVRFLWDEDRAEVENELDVIAVAGTQLICISCKDTRRYNSGSLNELDIYAEQIGGTTVKKILVATKPSKGQYVDERAEKMGIKILVFDGDVDKFKTQMDEIIND
ncbi:DUF1887 family protein [Vallitalea pronyensis]|uniref:DUF1887 family protein n=1 Tax=Vallitalea pronyensis TaxID=1348613 RepID=A0A8J8SFH4_9FIRM|nr:DUF1887 family CARF protein [Vallitalea pronyensis]QUI21357.1 DUF1887 family protein [Vallitalea pronyensis]